MIRVAGLAEARAVLGAKANAVLGAKTNAVLGTGGNGEIRLLSPPLALPGLGWWRELVRCLRAEFPDRDFEAVADCGPSAGLALAALRAGLGPVAAEVPPEVWNKLNDIATQAGTRMARVEDAAP